MKYFFTLCLSLLVAVNLAAEEWSLVPSASMLQAGDKVVIACNSQNATAGTSTGQNAYLSAVTSSFNSQKSEITALGNGTLIFTLGGSDGAWTFTTENGQLLGTTDNRKLQVDGQGTTKWTISITDGDAVIASENTSCGTIQYNTASPRFWCTTGSQNPIHIYRLGEPIAKFKLTYEGFPYKRTSCAYPSYFAGAKVKLASGSPKNAEGQVVVAWMFKGETFEAGSEFTMPAEDAVLVPVWGEEQGFESVQSTDSKVQKILRDGQLIIIRDGKEYNILGGRLL